MWPTLLAFVLGATTPAVDERMDGAVADAVDEALAGARDAVRVAVPPVDDVDEKRGRALERALVRALVDRHREEIVTPAYLRAKLAAQAIGREEARAFACDHVLLASVGDEEGRAVLRLKLLHTETGAVLSTSSAALGAGAPSSARGVRVAMDELVDQIAVAVESQGREVRTHRTAVAVLGAQGAAKGSHLDTHLQAELVRGLARRGFLVVERRQLAAALDQMALGQVLDEAS